MVALVFSIPALVEAATLDAVSFADCIFLISLEKIYSNIIFPMHLFYFLFFFFFLLKERKITLNCTFEWGIYSMCV